MLAHRKHYSNADTKHFLVDNIRTMDVGTAITQTLTIRGINAAEVSRRSGLRPGTISSYQSGRTTPSLQALELIARALEVRVSELIARAEEARNETPPTALQDPGAGYVVEIEGSSQERFFACFSALSDRQQRALLSFLEAMEEHHE